MPLVVEEVHPPPHFDRSSNHEYLSGIDPFLNASRLLEIGEKKTEYHKKITKSDFF